MDSTFSNNLDNTSLTLETVKDVYKIISNHPYNPYRNISSLEMNRFTLDQFILEYEISFNPIPCFLGTKILNNHLLPDYIILFMDKHSNVIGFMNTKMGITYIKKDEDNG